MTTTRSTASRLPSAPAVAGEDAISGARRAIAAQLDIEIADQAEQMAPIPNLPPLMLYRASGGLSTVVFMKALQPPVEPQEDYDLSDDEDDYDWCVSEPDFRVDGVR